MGEGIQLINKIREVFLWEAGRNRKGKEAAIIYTHREAKK